MDADELKAAIPSIVNDVKFKTTPRDPRFPNMNQAQHCWTRYNEWVLCTKKEDDPSACRQARGFARSICPNEYIEKWDEERENGNFAGVKTD